MEFDLIVTRTGQNVLPAANWFGIDGFEAEVFEPRAITAVCYSTRLLQQGGGFHGKWSVIGYILTRKRCLFEFSIIQGEIP